MQELRPKRDSFVNSPNTEDIMSSVSPRSTISNYAIKELNNAVTPAKTKATYYLKIDLYKMLKRYAFESETSQSNIIELAVGEYIVNHPVY